MIESLSRPRPRIPVADAPALRGPARRTSLLRLALAAALVLALGACVWLAADLRTRPSSYFAAGGGGIVVLDLSTSVDPNRYRRIARVVRTIAETSQPVGVVTYSDTAYELLPPGTSGEELRPLLRFFEPPERGGADARRTRGFGFLESPWSGTFRGGTRISTGLRVAREMVERDRLAPATVLLVSDLDDSPFDLEAVTQEAIRYEREGIDLRIVPLFPGAEDRSFFANLAGPGAFVRNDELLRSTALEERRAVVGGFPLALVLAAAVLLGLLAVNERVCARLGLVDPEGRMSARRVLVVAGGIVAIVAAVALFVLALDVLRWRDHVEAADLRFAAATGNAAMWEPDTTLPAGVARTLLAVEDDLAFRRAVQRFRVSRIGLPAREQNDIARRGRVDAELARLERTDLGPRRRSLVANLQGALAFEEAREDSGQAAVLLRRSLASFRRAVRNDPANEDAKYNLELVLALLERAESSETPGGGGQRGDTRASGAGAASSGSGY